MSRRRFRCAIYTRKSTEDGLEQDFNSLDAQREACAAYIKSQAGEGWILVQARYDDGGVSGGTMDRPALNQLLADITEHTIDTVVVYKVDRLTRSLADFAKIVDVFDAHGVSFVSVTQAFNTTTSMGRLTLNMLLSFAQFEREVTSERIRDKFAASKKKGMWMGGLPPLGYDVQDRKLVINDTEAESVRQMFGLYVELGTVRRLKDEADRRGILTKRRRQRNGKVTGGRPFTRGNLYQLLSNPIYIGKIAHKGETYAGQHNAIIDTEIWSQVQANLARNGVRRNVRTNAKATSPLAGLVFDETGDRLCLSHTVKNGRRYRYYVSKRLIHGSGRHDVGWRLPAAELEAAVISVILSWFEDPWQLFNALQYADHQPASLNTFWQEAKHVAKQLHEDNDGCRGHILKSIIRRIDLSSTTMAFTCARSDLAQILNTDHASIEADVNDCVTLTKPIKLRRRGIGARLVIGEPGEMQAKPNPNLCALIARARMWFEQLASGDVPSVRAIAVRDKVHETEVSRALPLAFLAPDIVTAILDGSQSEEITTKSLRRISDLPLAWNQQRQRLGFSG